MDLRTAFHCFARNGRWGTCVSCPRIRDVGPLPELCEYTERYDHLLTVDELVDAFKQRGLKS